jgi:hypothetical protein
MHHAAWAACVAAVLRAAPVHVCTQAELPGANARDTCTQQQASTAAKRSEYKEGGQRALVAIGKELVVKMPLPCMA